MDQAQAVAVHGTASGLERDIAGFRRHLRGTDKSPRTQQSYGDVLALFSRCLTAQGMPTDIRAIRREHVEAFIADLLERSSRAPPTTATPGCSGSSAVPSRKRSSRRARPPKPERAPLIAWA